MAKQQQTDIVELARRRVRGLLGYSSLPYRLAVRTLDLGSVLLGEGPATTLTLERLQASSEAGRPPALVKFKRLQHPISLRPGSRDAATLISNAVRLEYGQLKLSPSGPHFIVDGGAYIGDTSSFFLSQYPAAKVIALEPNPDSFAIAKRNLAAYGTRVVILNNALADKLGTLFLSGVETGARVGMTGSVPVDCGTVADLIDLSPTRQISVLKLDIEGAEKALFSDGAEVWLDKVDHIIVETHGPDCEKAVLATLDVAKWTTRRYRNLYYCSRGHV